MRAAIFVFVLAVLSVAAVWIYFLPEAEEPLFVENAAEVSVLYELVLDAPLEEIIEEGTIDEDILGEEELEGDTFDEEISDEEIFDEEIFDEEIPFVPIFTREPLPYYIVEFISGVTFHYHAPFDHCFLTYLTITHVGFDGQYDIGHMIVAEEIGDEVLEIFEEIFESRFPIYSIRLMDYFGAVDYYSLAANNSSSFNFRYIAGTNTLSRHAFGMAIDINPIQNPYIRGSTIWPAAGYAYMDRSYLRPGMITRGCPVYTAFVSRGWVWGGNWTSPRDYHHFERR